MQEAVRNRIDFLSVLPVLVTESFWERLIQPVCAAIMMLWFRPERVNDPHRTAAYANGAFMLMSRGTYEAIGEHDAVRTQLNEDIHMARLCKQRGRRLFVIENDGLYVTRMYTSFREAWRGWSRIFYGCFGTLQRILLTLIVVFMFSVLPFLSLLVAGVALLVTRGATHDGWMYVFGIAAVVIVVLESVILRFMRIAPRGALGVDHVSGGHRDCHRHADQGDRQGRGRAARSGAARRTRVSATTPSQTRRPPTRNHPPSLQPTLLPMSPDDLLPFVVAATVVVAIIWVVLRGARGAPAA